MNKIIVVPLDLESDKAIDFGNQAVNISEWVLTLKEFSILDKSGILEEIGFNLNLILGDFEQQKIEYELLFKLKDIVENFQISIANLRLFNMHKKLKKMIDLAIDAKTSIYFFF